MAHAIRSGKRGASVSKRSRIPAPLQQRRTAAKGRTFRQLRRNELEARDKLEVLHVERGHIEAEIESGGPDHEVFEGDDIALGSLFAFDASGQLRDFQRHRMHDQIVEGCRMSSMEPPRRSLAIRMLVSRIKPKASVPCRRIAWLAVADDLFHVGGELGVHHRLIAQLSGVGFGERDGLRQEASWPCGDDRQLDGGRGVVDDDFDSGADAGGISFRDADHCHGHDDTRCYASRPPPKTGLYYPLAIPHSYLRLEGDRKTLEKG